VVEAITWAGLLAGMFLKYVTETTEAGVWLFGRLHGAAFVAYVVVALVVAVRYRWGWWRALVALAAAVPPLTTPPAEWWLRRTGHLSEPAAREPEPAPVG
jgi:integral membrane protein